MVIFSYQESSIGQHRNEWLDRFLFPLKDLKFKNYRYISVVKADQTQGSVAEILLKSYWSMIQIYYVP